MDRVPEKAQLGAGLDKSAGASQPAGFTATAGVTAIGGVRVAAAPVAAAAAVGVATSGRTPTKASESDATTKPAPTKDASSNGLPSIVANKLPSVSTPPVPRTRSRPPPDVISRVSWSSNEDEVLIKQRRCGIQFKLIARKLNRTIEACKKRFTKLKRLKDPRVTTAESDSSSEESDSESERSGSGVNGSHDDDDDNDDDDDDGDNESSDSSTTTNESDNRVRSSLSPPSTSPTDHNSDPRIVWTPHVLSRLEYYKSTTHYSFLTIGDKLQKEGLFTNLPLSKLEHQCRQRWWKHIRGGKSRMHTNDDRDETTTTMQNNRKRKRRRFKTKSEREEESDEESEDEDDDDGDPGSVDDDEDEDEDDDDDDSDNEESDFSSFSSAGDVDASWCETDIDRLIHLVYDVDPGVGVDWLRIGRELGRSPDSCQRKWLTFTNGPRLRTRNRTKGQQMTEVDIGAAAAAPSNRLPRAPSIPWTPAAESELCALASQRAPSQHTSTGYTGPTWAEIARQMNPPRTMLQCFMRWRKIQKQGKEGDDTHSGDDDTGKDHPSGIRITSLQSTPMSLSPNLSGGPSLSRNLAPPSPPTPIRSASLPDRPLSIAISPSLQRLLARHRTQPHASVESASQSCSADAALAIARLDAKQQRRDERHQRREARYHRKRAKLVAQVESRIQSNVERKAQLAAQMKALEDEDAILRNQLASPPVTRVNPTVKAEVGVSVTPFAVAALGLEH